MPTAILHFTVARFGIHAATSVKQGDIRRYSVNRQPSQQKKSGRRAGGGRMEWGVHGGSQEAAALHGKGIGSVAGVYAFSLTS